MLPKGLLKEYSRALSILIRVMDVIVVFIAACSAYLIKFNTSLASPAYVYAIMTGIFLAPIVFSFSNLYGAVRGRSYLSHFVVLTRAVLIFALLLAGLAFLTKSGEHYSRAWFSMWMSFSFVLLVLYRCSILMLLRYMRARGMNEKRAVIIGAGVLGQKFAGTVQQALWTGFRILSFIDDNVQDKPSHVHQIPVIAMPSNLSGYLKENQIDELWLALPLRAEKRVKDILHSLRHDTVATRLVLDISGLDLINHSITDLAGFPVLNISTSPMMGVNRLVKAMEDRLLGLLITIFISPFLLLITIGVKLTSEGPVLFKQQRLGRDGRVINVYKFRTMYVHHEDAGQITQASANDQRITPFGRFLRKTSLDELPQFINVLQGKMSIVGPRPHALPHNEQYKDAVHTYMQRHKVKPGITGWAQVNGWRGETDTLEKMQKRVEFDLYYINNWSLAFDLKIIFLTFFRGFIGKNAY